MSQQLKIKPTELLSAQRFDSVMTDELDYRPVPLATADEHALPVWRVRFLSTANKEQQFGLEIKDRKSTRLNSSH